MSDDQMRGLKDLLGTEGNDPPDVTAPIPRPRRRGRRLSALTEASPPPRPAGAQTAPPSDPAARTPAGPRAKAAPSPTRPPGTEPRAAAPRSTPVDPTPVDPTPVDPTLTPRRKTSVTLPPVVRDRIADAYHHGRWTLLALLELAGERLATGEIARPDLEAVVASLTDGGGSASIRSLSVPASLLERFDERSTAWRLSRSALVAACLVLVLDQLPE